MIVFRMLRFFIWVGVLAGVVVMWSGLGTPHVIWSYAFQTSGSRFDPFAERRYTSCTYLGWGFSQVTEPARNGRCGWLRFRRSETNP